MSDKNYQVKKILIIWSRYNPSDVNLIRMISNYDHDHIFTCPTKETLIATKKMPSYIQQTPSLIFLYVNGEVSIIDDIDELIYQVHDLLGLHNEMPITATTNPQNLSREETIESVISQNKTPNSVKTIGQIANRADVRELSQLIKMDFPRDERKHLIPKETKRE